MTEPQQKDLLTNRWRNVRKVDLKEHQLQIALVQHLKLRARPGVLYFHVPNGELRDKRAAAKLKAMGVLPGVADLLFVWNDDAAIQQPCTRVLFLELKRDARSQLSDDQFAFAKIAEDVGAVFDIAHSLDEALAVLKSLDLLKC